MELQHAEFACPITGSRLGSLVQLKTHIPGEQWQVKRLEPQLHACRTGRCPSQRATTTATTPTTTTSTTISMTMTMTRMDAGDGDNDDDDEAKQDMLSKTTSAQSVHSRLHMFASNMTAKLLSKDQMLTLQPRSTSKSGQLGAQQLSREIVAM